ncbi:glycopeptide resistance protein VanZ1 [Paeniglutamicibacter psychrophenolicus]|uniref:Glycopeptide antibiotics resistance protein n=1 Tax=Paeniglutamicibacter psychrophenolicus TaxID=257454 RepID=A0ABS4WL42_9MICC|nr:VanZ family protein [Paeniglutamicibacter psychrophenolicus]MBP2376284.1 glycopeptide antibiotics resistance protein [Paeniglutamicibacter psychrophenolicus]
MPVSEKMPSRERGRVLLVGLSAIYLVLLAWLVLWKLEVPYIGAGALRQVKLVPFAAGSGFGASPPFEVVANFVLFVPFGLYLGLFAPSLRWWKAAGVAAGASLALEIAQYVMSLGSSGATDLVVNTAGGPAGIGMLALAHRRLRARTSLIMTRVCSIGTVFALLLAGIFVASPLRYAPPRDVAGASFPPAGDHTRGIDRAFPRAAPMGLGNLS